jgi:hypothetical protein
MPQNPPKRPWEERVTEAGARFQEELHRVVRYIDDEVVPEVRRNSSSALRAAADQLQKLAQHMDDTHAAQEDSAKSADTPETR